MAEASSRGNPGQSDSRLAGVCGILLGMLVIATFAASYNFPAAPSQADATLAQFGSFRSAFLAGDILFLLGAWPVSGASAAIVAGVVLILVWFFATSGLMWRSGTPRGAP